MSAKLGSMKLADIPELAGASQTDLREVTNELLELLGYPTLAELASSEDVVSDGVKSTLDNRWAEYKKDPSIALNLEQVIDFVRKNR